MIVFLQRLFSGLLSGKIGVIEISTNAVKYLSGYKLTNNFDFDKYNYGSIFTDSGRLGLHNGRLSLKFLNDVILPAIFFAIDALINSGVKRDNIKIISTALLREASNADECVSLIEEKTSLPMRVVSGDEEAVGAISAFLKTTKRDFKDKYVVGVDLGGGSTEIAVIQNNKVLFKKSYRVGMSLGKKEPIVIPDKIFKDKNKEIVIVGNGFALSRAAGLNKQTMHDASIPVDQIKEEYRKNHAFAPLPELWIDLADELGCDYIIGNGTGNVFSEFLDKKLD